MKRQMINIEQLKFPSGIAAAETLRSLYAASDEGKRKARALFGAMGLGAVVAWFRDAHAAAQTGVLAWLTRLSKIPAQIPIPGLTIAGLPAAKWTIALEGSLLLMAGGGLMGLRTTTSMLVTSLLNYALLAPFIRELGGITGEVRFRAIVTWSLWPGAAIMVTSGLLSVGLQWRTAVRAFAGLGKLFRRRTKAAGTLGGGAYQIGRAHV